MELLSIRTRELHSLEEWNQFDNFLPPPYVGGMRRAAEGYNVGDPDFDALDRGIVLKGMHTDPSVLPEREDPSWKVDWALVAKGQRVLLDRLDSYQMGMTFALLVGFSNMRAAVVLAASGYSVSPKVTFDRYCQTFFFIIDWLSHPLDDPASLARQRVKQVRAMHSYARRKSIDAELFPENGGVPISQYDMVMTLAAFTTAPWELMRNLGVVFTTEEKEAIVATYRVIGWYLGIEDRYNTHHSLEAAVDAYTDIKAWTLNKLESIHESGVLLQNIVTEAFGRHTPAGATFWRGFLGTMYHPVTKRLVFGKSARTDALKLSSIAAPPPVVSLFLFAFALDKYVFNVIPGVRWLRRAFARSVSQRIIDTRALYLKDKAEFRARISRFERMSKAADTYLWPLYSYAVQAAIVAVPILAAWLVWAQLQAAGGAGGAGVMDQ